MPTTVRPTQRSFSAGVLTGWLAGRADQDKFKSGLKFCKNFLLTPFGPIRRRMGTKFSNVARYSGSRKVRVFGFQASTEEGYCIELGHLYMRFHRNGEPVLDGGTPYQIITPWTEDQIFDVHYTSINDVTFLVHPDVPVQLLSYFSATDWTIAPMMFDFPPMMDENLTSVTLTITDFTNIPVTETIDFDVASPAPNVTSEVLISAGAYEVVVNSITPSGTLGEQVRLEGSTDGGTTWNPIGAPITAVGNYNGTYNGRLRLVANEYTIDSTLSVTVDNPLISKGDNITVQASAAIFSPEMVGSYFAMSHRQEKSELRLFLNGAVVSDPISVVGKYTLTTTGLWNGTLTLEKSRDNGATWDKVIERSADKDRNISFTGEEKDSVLMRLRYMGGGDDERWATLELDNNLVEGVFRITNYVSPTEVDGVVEIAFSSQEATTLWKQGSWSGAAGYPRTVQWHANRMCFGGTADEPGKIWFSAIEDYYNFKDGTDDDDAFSKALGGNQQEIIQWMASRQVLAIGTAGGEWIGANGDDQSIVTPTGFSLSLQSGNGGARQMAVVANNTVLFVQQTGRKLREFSYSVTDNSFGGVDMTQLCIDVTKGGIKDCCLQRQRDTTFWATTGEGLLISMIYERSQNVIGWTTHDTRGRFESVASVFEEGEEDSIYVVVNREIQGNPVRYIERMVPNQFRLLDDAQLSMMPFMDAFRTFDGTSTSPGFTDLSDFMEKLAGVTAGSNVNPINGYAAIKAAADQIIWDSDPSTQKAIIMLADDASVGVVPILSDVLTAVNAKSIKVSQGPDFSAFMTNNYTPIVTNTGGATWLEGQINTQTAIFNSITGLFPTAGPRLELCIIIDKLATPADSINFQNVVNALKATMANIDAHLQTKFDEIGYSLMSVNALGYVFETVASPTTESVVTGLDHLIGEPVQILADGVYIEGQTVSPTGTVTLPEAAAVVHVGIGYDSVLETLPTSIQLGNGDSTSNMKRVSVVDMRVYRSVSAETAPTYNYSQSPWEPLSYSNRNPVDFDEPVPMGQIGYLEDWRFQGHPGNAKDPRIAIRQREPFPLCIVEIQTTIEIAQ